MTPPPDDETAVPLGTLRRAVTTLRRGLVDHQVIDAARWDRAVATVGRSQLQLNDPARRHVYAVFRAARWNAAPLLEAAIIELEDHLAEPPLGPGSAGQLSLFPLVDLGDGETRPAGDR